MTHSNIKNKATTDQSKSTGATTTLATSLSFILILSMTLSLALSSVALAGHDRFSKFSSNQSEQISHQMSFDTTQADNHLTLFNVYGSITVEGHAADTLVLSAVNHVYANNETEVQMGLDEIGLKYITHDNRTYIYLDSPFTHFEADTGDIWHSDTCVTRYNCAEKYTEKKPYLYQMNITVKVPHNTNLKVSAINDGDITISHIDAQNINVSNINGAIDMSDVTAQTKAYAINQDVNISYSKNPSKPSSFESINGDLNIAFAQRPDAKIIYKTMNGDMYTKYDYTQLPLEVITTAKENKHGNKYKVAANHPIQLGTGGPTYTFKTLNGDIEIK